MDIRKHRSRTLKIGNFKQDEDEKFVFEQGNYKIAFYELYGAKPKMYIQLWYLENRKAYLKEEMVLNRSMTKNKFVIEERNKEMWNVINNLYERYF